MIDESLLDAPDELLRADPHGMLRAVAASGAQVRTAARGAEESDLGRLTPEGRPGTLLVAGTGPATPLTAGLLTALAGDSVRVAHLRPTGPLAAHGALTWPLPRWVGSLDLLLLTTSDGSEPGLALLVEAAFRRGCAVAVIAPADSPLAGVAAHRRSPLIPLTPAPYLETGGPAATPGHAWALVTPALMLADRLGLLDPAPGTGPDEDPHASPAALQLLADRLDTVAERCGPTVRTSDNPAKTLASAFSDTLPLLWSEGPVAGAAARHAAATLTALAGRPALAAELPEALDSHRALLTGNLAAAPGGDPDDFFRDRVDEPPPLHARVLLLRSPLPPTDQGTGSAADSARDLALGHGVAFGEPAIAEGGGLLATAAELIAQLDFAAVYLALATGARG
ncbi:SIS domain-containing protein [Streptomyces avicenniae]|uniref:SIS domain-containing protein n=1 Tax=Streptomyces avicenniae TaxID=500153 RepID=UPI00069ACBB5|nr:SIS domain-containing protein [Streptomyces avicenniae]